MIKKINKIKNLGIFSDYQDNATLPEFKKFNLLYGWNGCGKTTLSDLFVRLQNGALSKYPELEYEINTDSGKITQNDNFPWKIRVFNQDYISNNVQLSEGTAKPIYILGEENKKILDQIKHDEQELIKNRDALKLNKDDATKKTNSKDSKFTDIARTISSNTSGEATRKYDRRNAEFAFKKISDNHYFDDNTVEKFKLTLRQLEKPSVNYLSFPTLKLKNDSEKEYKIEDLLELITNDSKDLCKMTVKSKIIARLKENTDISNWVELGLTIHDNHASTKCEFCDQVLPENRLSALLNHFNKEDKTLKDNIDLVIENITLLISTLKTINPPDKANFYEELQGAYEGLKTAFIKELDAVIEKLDELETKLYEKKTKTTEAILVTIDIDFKTAQQTLSDLNGAIKKHNDKTDNFKDEKSNAQNELEIHYLKTIFDDVETLEKDIADLLAEKSILLKNISSLQQEIIDNKSKITSPQGACEEINKKVAMFLGRCDIKFEVEGEGYVIKRGNDIAKYLSEGEKTAIAFAYFTVQLKDQDFDITNGLIVIDDPVSSLDCNSLFQAFSFLKNSVKDAKQVFIFTHNFDFLRLLLNWLNHRKNRSITEKFMVNNKDTDKGRIAFIDILDKDLQDHESEYQYLFKKLYLFESDGTIASVYNIPNIARKVMDTFLMFRVPNSEDNYAKLESLKDIFDENKITSIYKFTNDESHITGKGFDPALVPETQKNVKYLLDLIQTVFPEHYKILEESILHP